MAGDLYWATFRIADDGHWDRRYKALKAAITESSCEAIATYEQEDVQPADLSHWLRFFGG